MESPETWFEDFGRGDLTNGEGRVELDLDFLAVVQPDDYYVCLTPEAECNSLYVSEKRARWFAVREHQGGGSSLPFAYRVVARRRDIEGRRFETVDLPELPDEAPSPFEPSELPDVPEPLPPPEAPEPREAPEVPGLLDS